MGRAGSGTRVCDLCEPARLTCLQFGRYVLMGLVLLFMCLHRSILRHLRRSPIVSMGARRASCAIVRRCAMGGIELDVYTSFVQEQWCPCVAFTRESDKGPFIYRCNARM